MGVPSFYRWLVSRYPKVVVSAVEEEPPLTDDPWAVSSSPPNGPFDNLYLDMNWIIHSCFHPEDQLFPPTTEDEVFLSMFGHIDRVFGVVRPRKLLYLAIDGVAPRAKMNQQRCRRFRAAKDAEFAEAEEERLRREFHRKGKPVLPKAETQLGDSNLITPGTAFMARLSGAMQYYIRSRINSHPGWKNLKVILSDANVPGEGEHKIMAFIRLQRNRPGYDPNTRHCLYGMDADLIMLALATHELHFCILREDILTQTSQDISSVLESSLSEPVLERLKSNACVQRAIARKVERKPLQLLNIWTLREYLEQDFTIPDTPLKLDIERVVDDFVFICFFAGNDFLPHLPSLEINENALDLLIHVYKAEFKNMGGYLIDTSRIKEKKAAFVKAKRMEMFILAVGRFETKIFMKRYNLMQAKLKRIMQQKMEIEAYKSELLVSVDEDHFESVASPEAVGLSLLTEKCNIRNSTSKLETAEITRNTKELFLSLKKSLQDKGDLLKNEIPGNDKIKLGHPGWEDRYYREKFSLKSCSEIQQWKKELVEKYTEGLCWILLYYYSGVCSWEWYYPFHYAPFASDLRGMSWSSLSFKLGKPVKPFEQLLSVLPPRSAPALPEAYAKLMTCEESRLALFYPKDFEVDTFGKRFLWQGTVKLPFIEEGLVLTEAHKHESDLKDEEKVRNRVDFDRIFEIDFCLCSSADQMGSELTQNQRRYPSPMVGMEDIEEDAVICSVYMNPDPHEHVPRLLEGVDIPEKTVTASDIEWRPLWHEHQGSRPPADVIPRPTFGRGRGRVTVADTDVAPRPTFGRGRGRGTVADLDVAPRPTFGRGRGRGTVADMDVAPRPTFGRGRGRVTVADTEVAPRPTFGRGRGRGTVADTDVAPRPTFGRGRGRGTVADMDVAPRPTFGRGRGRGTAADTAATAAGCSIYGRSSSVWSPKLDDAPHSSSLSASGTRGRAASGNAYQHRGFGTAGQERPSGGGW